MRECILHAGISKTGTTSIQESLFLHLSDERFRYVSLGHGHANTLLKSCFGRPEDDWVARRSGASRSRLLARGVAHRLRFERALHRARARGATPILSAEGAWLHPRSTLEAVRDFLAARGFEARVVLYLRPIEAWLESAFQQNVKWGLGSFDVAEIRESSPGMPRHAFARRLAVFEDVFGRPNLTLRRFAAGDLLEGCVVRDFCALLGIDFDPRRVVRANESLGLDAVRFLFAYNRYASSRLPASNRLVERMARTFEGLPGARFRVCREVFAPLGAEIRHETAEIRRNYGIDLAEDPGGLVDGPCIREAADLARFSRPSLDWLARAAGTTAIREGEGEETARLVARDVERSMRRAALRQGPGEAKRMLERRLRWIRYGD